MRSHSRDFHQGPRTSVAKVGLNEKKGIAARDGGTFFLIMNYIAEFETAYGKYKAELLAGKGNLQAMFDRAISGSKMPDEARKVFDPGIVASLPSTPYSGGVSFFVPTAGPMPSQKSGNPSNSRENSS